MAASFEPTVRALGDRLFLEEGICGAAVDGRTWVAHTSSAPVHEVRVQLEPTEIRWRCSCPAALRLGRPCEHLWATLLEWEHSAPDFHRRAQALGDPVTLRWSEESESAPRAAEESWRSRLPRPADTDPWLALELGRSAIRYAVDVADSRHRGALVLLRERPTGAPGTELDAQIDAALEGAELRLRRERPRDRHELDAAHSTLLLPLLVATGRTRLRDASGAAGPVLARRVEATSVIAVVETHSTLDSLRVGFVAVVDGERRDLRQADLHLPGGHWFLGELVVHTNFDPRAVDAAWGGADVVELRAPAGRLETLMEVIAAIEGIDAVEWEGRTLERRTPRPDVTFGDRQRGRTACRLSFDYDGTKVPVSPSRGLARDAEGTWFLRDRAAERRALEELVLRGARPAPELEGEDATLGSDDEERCAQELAHAGWKVARRGRAVRAPEGMALRLRTGIDWFDLDGSVRYAGGLESSLADVLRARRAGRSGVPLADGSIGLYPEWAGDWELLEVLDQGRGDEVRVHRSQGLWLEQALEGTESDGTAPASVAIEVDEPFQRLRDSLRSFSGIAAQDPPAAFRGKLREYQRVTLGWFEFLRRSGLGGCLADDMGLGKTVQVLALLAGRIGTGRPPSLVVAPRSLVGNWCAEAQKFVPSLRARAHLGSDRDRSLPAQDADVWITTYGTLRQDADLLARRKFDYLVLDEAHAIKNPSSVTARACRLLDARHRLAITGTPIENRLQELFSLLEFLNPGSSKRLAAPLEAQGEDEERGERHRRLGRALRPLFLRRTKEQVLEELPAKTEQVLCCELSGLQEAEYRAQHERTRRLLLEPAAVAGSDRPESVAVLEALLRLRQIACHPGLVDPTRRAESSAKLEVLLPHLEELCERGHKALVFSQFTRFLDVVSHHLQERGLAHELLTGATRDREGVVRRFQETDERRILLLSLGAGGVGLNLTRADYVFLLDPWWNPFAERQAIDRAHRMGQRRAVVAYRLIVKDSVEEKVQELQKRKTDLAHGILDEAHGVQPTGWTRADLENLLG